VCVCSLSHGRDFLAAVLNPTTLFLNIQYSKRIIKKTMQY